ncbi:MAG: M28 family peptidase [Candidatus Poseidoniaceae archaeon]
MRMGIAVILALLLMSPALTKTGGQEGEEAPIGCQLSFDGDIANQSVQFQTDLGPRLPGSAASSELRESIKSNMSGWHITESTHHVNGMVLTNLFATWNKGAGSTVMFAAHYDTRHKGDLDWNESMRDKPIDGANDGASGVAVLIELARHIPSMNLTHEVTLFFTDGEDQGEYSNASSWILGARAWADNLTISEADKIESFILVDMIGDSDLTLRKTNPGNTSLWNRTENKIRYLDEVCNYGESTYFDFEEYDSIIDDHVPADELGIPAIDIIDTRYGEGASFLGGHWHTHNDTADKVSADSLQKIGYILESGLKTGSWLNIRVQENTESAEQEQVEDNDNEEHGETSDLEADEMFIGVLLICCTLLVWGNLAWLIFADNRGEG